MPFRFGKGCLRMGKQAETEIPEITRIFGKEKSRRETASSNGGAKTEKENGNGRKFFRSRFSFRTSVLFSKKDERGMGQFFSFFEKRKTFLKEKWK